MQLHILRRIQTNGIYCELELSCTTVTPHHLETESTFALSHLLNAHNFQILALVPQKFPKLPHIERPKEELLEALDDVHTGVGPDWSARLPNLQRKRGVLERLLHLAATERSEIAAALR
jgi:hypothetical protein